MRETKKESLANANLGETKKLKVGLYRIRDGSMIGIQLLLTRRVSYC